MVTLAFWFGSFSQVIEHIHINAFRVYRKRSDYNIVIYQTRLKSDFVIFCVFINGNININENLNIQLLINSTLPEEHITYRKSDFSKIHLFLIIEKYVFIIIAYNRTK